MNPLLRRRAKEHKVRFRFNSRERSKNDLSSLPLWPFVFEKITLAVPVHTEV